MKKQSISNHILQVLALCEKEPTENVFVRNTAKIIHLYVVINRMMCSSRLTQSFGRRMNAESSAVALEMHILSCTPCTSHARASWKRRRRRDLLRARETYRTGPGESIICNTDRRRRRDTGISLGRTKTIINGFGYVNERFRITFGSLTRFTYLRTRTDTRELIIRCTRIYVYAYYVYLFTHCTCEHRLCYRCSLPSPSSQQHRSPLRPS